MIEKIVIYGPSFSRTWALNCASHNVLPQLRYAPSNKLLRYFESVAFFTPHIKLNNFSIKDANFMKFKPYQFQPKSISYI